MLHDRGITAETIKRLGIGYAPPAYEGLKAALVKEGLPLPLLVRSGLAVERDNGQTVDRFRGRLMIPIARDAGSIVAFGGRAMEKDQQPKYLNSPETSIYTKGKTLYGLNLTKGDIRRLGYAVLVEGYFDFAQLVQAGITPVVASSGTALTPAQAQLLRRFTSKVILSFDPDAAGQGAAARSCELLVAEGFEVNVAVLPAGEDPDSFVQKRGRDAYLELLKHSRPYLEYLLDRAAAAHDLTNDEGRRQFLTAMLAVAARIPDPAARDQFGDRLAHKARITEEVVRAEVRKAAVQKRPELTARDIPTFGEVKRAEKGLIWALVHEPEQGMAALNVLQDNDLEGLSTRHILEEARALADRAPAVLPSALFRASKSSGGPARHGHRVRTAASRSAAQLCPGIAATSGGARNCRRPARNGSPSGARHQSARFGNYETLAAQRGASGTEGRTVAKSAFIEPLRLSCRVRATRVPCRRNACRLKKNTTKYGS